MKRKRYDLEVEFEIDFVPYTCLAEGNDLEELIADAQYNKSDSDNGNKFLDIGNLPQKQYDFVIQELTAGMAGLDELRAEELREQSEPALQGAGH